MTILRTILAALLLCAAPAEAQTLKSLMFNTTNGQVIANTGTNVLTFTNNAININSIADTGFIVFDVINSTFYTGVTFTENVELEKPLSFFGTNATGAAATTRTNLGLGGGITTNVTFVDAATNTNSVTISNGIITGWTQ